MITGLHFTAAKLLRCSRETSKILISWVAICAHKRAVTHNKAITFRVDRRADQNLHFCLHPCTLHLACVQRKRVKGCTNMLNNTREKKREATRISLNCDSNQSSLGAYISPLTKQLPLATSTAAPLIVIGAVLPTQATHTDYKSATCLTRHLHTKISIKSENRKTRCITRMNWSSHTVPYLSILRRQT